MKYYHTLAVRRRKIIFMWHFSNILEDRIMQKISQFSNVFIHNTYILSLLGNHWNRKCCCKYLRLVIGRKIRPFLLIVKFQTFFVSYVPITNLCKINSTTYLHSYIFYSKIVVRRFWAGMFLLLLIMSEVVRRF